MAKGEGSDVRWIPRGTSRRCADTRWCVRPCMSAKPREKAAILASRLAVRAARVDTPLLDMPSGSFSLDSQARAIFADFDL